MDDKIKEVMGLVEEANYLSEKTRPVGHLLQAIESKLHELVPVWLPIESAPEMTSVLACNASGFVGRAMKINGKWEHIGRPTYWQPLPEAKK